MTIAWQSGVGFLTLPSGFELRWTGLLQMLGNDWIRERHSYVNTTLTSRTLLVEEVNKASTGVRLRDHADLAEGPKARSQAPRTGTGATAFGAKADEIRRSRALVCGQVVQWPFYNWSRHGGGKEEGGEAIYIYRESSV